MGVLQGKSTTCFLVGSITNTCEQNEMIMVDMMIRELTREEPLDMGLCMETDTHRFQPRGNNKKYTCDLFISYQILHIFKKVDNVSRVVGVTFLVYITHNLVFF